MILEVENLHKHFGPVRAVDGVRFSIQKGEVVGLLGPNGAGKTTTMRLVTGFLRPDTGEVSVCGIRVAQNPIEARKQIGYLPENTPLYPDMEVTEFLSYVLRLRRTEKGRQRRLIQEAIEQCGLGEMTGRTIGTLSRGYRQRVGLAAALIHNPPLLILDEPTSGLDPHQIQEIRNLIRQIGQERTVILSTHIMQEVQAVCKRALIMARGKLAGAGTLEELTQRKRGANRYVARIKAQREAIEKNCPKNLTIEKLDSANGVWQELVLTSPERADQSEAIFQWVVQNNWSLAELRREESSLEEVFLELTKQ